MADNGQLFNSKSDPVPMLRPALDIIPVRNNGQAYLYFHDPMGYATENFALDRQAGMVLSLLDGQKSIEDLSPYLGEGVTADQLLEYIRFLDEHRLLNSSHFRSHAEAIETAYENSPVHRSVTAGSSYPSDPDELRNYLDDAFSRKGGASRSPSAGNGGSIKALYAPHIDPRVGIDSYITAFSAIRHLEPRRVVILATSHYAGIHQGVYDHRPFILTRKDFELPLNNVRADRDAIDRMTGHSDVLGISEQDRAHRIEHSIELHLLFLSYLWDHDFEIVPILVRNFDDLFYMEDGHLAQQVSRFGEYMNERFGRDQETLFLISGDLAHVGKKFGDDAPASEMLGEVRHFDRSFMEFARDADAGALLRLVKDQYDPYRICGFAPLYSYLKAMPDSTGEKLSYDVWNETERESAVTFGSILYRR